MFGIFSQTHFVSLEAHGMAAASASVGIGHLGTGCFSHMLYFFREIVGANSFKLLSRY